MRWPGACVIHELAHGHLQANVFAQELLKIEYGDPRLVFQRLQSVVAFKLTKPAVLRTA